MGVKGLLPCLQSITRAVPLERYRGLAVAIDAMSWLHKGIFACNVRALAKSQRSNSATTSSEELDCVKYTIKKAEILRQKFGIDVLLVIDGDSLPSKKEENEQRRAERDKAFERAVAAENAGDSRSARRLYAQSCSITYNIRYELIKACKQASISFLVAPYEADAQMARLSHTNMVDLVITEDSDILAYGCPRALFKIDFDTFQGQEIQLMKDIGENDTLSFRNWTHDMFVFMCIISGCDYCKGVPGIGIKLAHKIVRVHRTPSKIFNALRSAGRMPPDFEESFWIAFRTFRHQRVFCLSKGIVEPLWPISGSKQKSDENYVWPFLGNHIESNTAREIAEGSLHPCKKIPWSEVTEPVVGSDSINTRTLERHLRHPTLSPQIKRAAPRESRSTHGKESTNNAAQQKKQGKEMFSFFSKCNKRANDDALQNNQPPLQEIYFVGNDGHGSTSESKHRPVPPRNHIDIPIHFHEYYSRLVGGSFKPLSRKRTKTDNVGTKSSKFVQRILQKSSEIQGLNDISKESRSVYGNGQTDFSENHGRNQLTEGECDNVRTSEYEQNHGFDKFRRQTVPPQDKDSTSSRGIENSFQVVESKNFGASSYSTNSGLLLKDDNFLYLEEANSQRQCSYDLCQSQYEQYQTHGSFVNEHHSNVDFSLSVQYMDCFDTKFGCNDETDSGNNAFPLNDDCCDHGSVIDYEFGGINDIGSFQQLQDEQLHRTGCFDDDFENIESTFQSFGNEFRINTNADYHGQKVSEGIFDENLLNTFDSLQKL